MTTIMWCIQSNLKANPQSRNLKTHWIIDVVALIGSASAALREWRSKRWLQIWCCGEVTADSKLPHLLTKLEYRTWTLIHIEAGIR